MVEMIQEKRLREALLFLLFESLGVTMTVGSKQLGWNRVFVKDMYVWVVNSAGNSDQALRLLCLKGHVRARGSMLWQHRWQEASEFFAVF